MIFKMGSSFQDQKWVSSLQDFWKSLLHEATKLTSQWDWLKGVFYVHFAEIYPTESHFDFQILHLN